MNRKKMLLWGIVIIYTLGIVITITFLGNKNQELESKKADILILKEEQRCLSKLENNLNSKNDEDIILSIQKNLEGIVNINYIDKEIVVHNEKNITQLSVNINSRLKDFDKLNDKLKDMKLDRAIKSIEAINDGKNKFKNLNYTIVFNIE